MTNEVKTSKLKALVDIQAGYQFRGKVEENPEGNGLLIQLRDISEGVIFQPSKDLTTISTDDIGEQYHIKDGDVLLPNRGRYSFAVLIIKPAAKIIAAGHFYILRVKAKDLVPSFLCWYINTRIGQHHLEKFKRGTSIPVLSKAGVEELEIPLPSISRQRVIGEVSILAKEEQELLKRLQDLKADQLEGSIFETLGAPVSRPA